MSTPRPFRLSLAQEDIYFDQLRRGIGSAYNVGGYIALEAVDPERLQRAHASLVGSEEIFGLRVRTGADGVQQWIQSPPKCDLAYVDLADQGDPSAAADEFLREAFGRPFELEGEPLFRAWLIRTGACSYRYAGMAHHIALDGWGFANWASKLSGLYGSAPSPSSSPGEWARHAEEDAKYASSSRYRDDHEYWLRQGLAEVPTLLAAHERAVADDEAPGPRAVRTLPGALIVQLESTAKGNDATLPQIVSAALAAMFARTCGPDALVIGFPVHNRRNRHAREMLGVFAGVSPMRVDIAGEDRISDVLRRLSSRQKEMLRHQRFPIGHLIREVQPQRGAAPIYDVGFNYLRLDTQLRFDERRADMVYLHHRREQTPAMFTLWQYPQDGRTELQIDCNSAYFSAASAERLADMFLHVLTQVSSTSDVAVDELDILAGDQLERLQAMGSGAELAGSDLSLHGLFEAQRARTPDAIAVEDGTRCYTYTELDARANAVARALVAAGVLAEEPVAVCLTRSADMLAALLGVLKSGAAYVPLDPDHPEDRRRYILADSGARIAIADQATCQLVAQARVIDLDATLSAPTQAMAASEVLPVVGAERLAYLIYTSGSTGRPKAVEIEHRNATALVAWAAATFQPDALGRVLASTSLNFDLSVFELFVPISLGHRCLIVRNVLELLDRKCEPTLVNTVPSSIRTLVASGTLPPSLRAINLAGERLTRELREALFAAMPGIPVYNLYGPSETTTYSTWRRFDAPDRRAPSIGGPIDGTRVYVLDRHGRLAPQGIPGELYIGGRGVARGYRNRPALTAQAFLPDPSASGTVGARMYRTGDQVRWREDGELEYLGRVDHQVKIRGHRIEPGEVEDALLSLDQLADCVVTAFVASDGETALAAYVVRSTASAGDQAEPEAIRSGLRARLPDYMVPASIVFLDRLPLNPNGKVDRAALPSPVADDPGQAGVKARPQTALQERLVVIWARVLGVSEQAIGVDDEFFAIGGHSLLAVRVAVEVRSALNLALPLRAVFEHSTVRALAAACAVQTVQPRMDGVIAGGDGPAPMSSAQQRLWFLHRLQGGSSEYHMAAAFRVSGLDPERMEQALRDVTERHETLRTVFRDGDSGPEQIVAEASRFALARMRVEGQAGLHEALVRFREAAFDLERELPLRAALIGSAHEQVFAFVVHHIVCDGWSVGLLVKALEERYRALSEGQRPGLAAPPVRYLDYARWQQQRLASGELEPQIAAWCQRLSDAPQLHGLPLDRERPELKSRSSKCVVTHLAPAVVKRLCERAQERGVTLFMLVHAAISLVLARHANASEIVVGTPMANRLTPELGGMIGLLANLVALRVDTSIRDLERYIAHVREVHLCAQEAQDVPFDVVVERLRTTRSLGHAPVFQVLLTMNAVPRIALDLPGAECSPIDLGPEPSKFDIDIDLTRVQQGLSVTWSYDTALFDAARIETIAAHFATLATGLADGVSGETKAVPMFPPEERQRLLCLHNATTRAFSEDATIDGLVAKQVESAPESIALSVEGRHWTYRELDAHVSALAECLAEGGARTGHVIGLHFERSFEMVVAMLAVLKCGAAYLPLDPHQPRARTAYMVDDSRIVQVLTNSGMDASMFGESVHVVAVDRILASGRTPGPTGAAGSAPGARSAQGLAYVIYTSGSTGRPKGVQVSHRALVNRLEWMQSAYPIGSGDRVLQKTPYTFDVSVWEFLWPLMCGATLVMARPEGHKDPAYLTQIMRTEQISVLHFVPSMLDEFLRTGEFATSVRLVFCSGEALSAETARRAIEAVPAAALHNLYGPTEAAIDVSYFPCAELGEARSVPIGKPIQNIRFYVVDGELEPVPDGCQGELLIGGVGLATGYLNRPELTAERFVPDPFAGVPGQRLYRTGDIVSWRADGRLEYWGRQDDQVKIRGFRIELGEIESRLATCTGVDAAVVVVQEPVPGQKQLVAYVIVTPDQADMSESDRVDRLRSELRGQLPDPMVPAHFVFLAEFPHTSSGKVDRRALPAPRLHASDRPSTPPSKAMERQLASIWSAVLGVAEGDLDIDTDFFEIGGHSLLAIRLVHAAKQQCGLDIPLHVVFRDRTLRKLASAVEAGSDECLPPLNAASGDRSLMPLSATQSRIWLAEQVRRRSNENNVCGGIRVRGGIDVERARHAIEAVVRRHPILTARIEEVDGVPMQRLGNAGPVPFAVHDLIGLVPEVQTERVRALVEAHADRRFDLSTAPLCEFLLIRLDEAEALVYMNMHHLVVDGWSLTLFIEEFLETYARAGSDSDCQTPTQAPHYADYSVWQEALLASDALHAQDRFWETYLAGAVPGCRLPRIVANEGAACMALDAVLPSALVNRLGQAAQAHGGSIVNALHAALSMLIARLSGEEDLLIGLPVSGRHVPGTERMLGAFVNVVPVRSRFDPSVTFDAWLRAEVADLHGVLSHQDVPYERIAAAAGDRRHDAGGALFDVILNVLSIPQPVMHAGGLRAEFAAIPQVDSKFGLAFYVEERGGELHLRCTHSPSALSRADAAFVLAQWVGLLRALAQDTMRPCGEYPLLPWSVDRRDERPDPSARQDTAWRGPVHLAFARAVDAVPEAVALTYRSRTWSYAALERRAALLAESLRKQGVAKGDIVAIAAQRSDALVVATLAVMMAGGAFMMLSARDPDAHRSALLRLGRPRLALTLGCDEQEYAALSAFHAAHGIATSRVELEVPDEQDATAAIADYRAAAAEVAAEDLAYIAYTSGSQGAPKPVLGRHSALTAYAPWLSSRFALGGDDSFAMLSGLTHDPLQRDMFTPLMNGATLHVPGDDDFQPRRVADWLAGVGARVVNLTPSLADFVFVGADTPVASLRWIFMVGEPLSAAHVALLRRIAPNARLVNLYGATETCRALAYHVLDEDVRPEGVIPVGRGMADVQVLVLATGDRLCSPGETGEICIRSPHMTLGYLGDPQATSRRFVSNPATGVEGDVVYRTGDRGYFLNDGQVVCMGRIDRQLKVRGFRVEPGAVEAALRQCPGVEQAAVDAVSRDGQAPALYAWVVLAQAAGSDNPARELRSALRAVLPSNAVPSTIRVVDRLPLTPSGKIDRAALLSLGADSAVRTAESPQTVTEMALVPIWRSLLGHDDIGVTDDFFELGGHSLLAVRLLARVRHDHGVQLDYAELFENGSIKSVAAQIDRRKAAVPRAKKKMVL